MEKMRTRLMVIIMLALLITSTAVVFAGGQSESDSDKGREQETRTIKLATIKNYYTTALVQIAKDYNEINPETKVEIEIIADNDTYLKNFKVKMSADKSKAPDIVHTNLLGEDEGNLITKGWLHSLDDLLLETNEYNNGLLVKDAIKDPTYLQLAVSSAGKTSHLPFDLVGVGVFFNKTIFDSLGLEAPTTYEEWEAVCQKLVEAGYENPIGAGVFNNWIMISLIDWAYRSTIPALVSLPGDGRYNETTMTANTEVKYVENDPSFDTMAVLDSEKLNIFLSNLDMDTAQNRTIWETYKSIAKYFPDNFENPDDGQTYNQFMGQKTPMYITGSWVVGQTLGEMAKLSEDRRFEWGTFLFPGFSNIRDGFSGSPRGLKVAGHKMGIADKNDEDLYERAADFLKYMYSSDVAAKIYDITFANNQYVQGPSLISGVELSQDIEEMLTGFDVVGNMRAELKGFGGNYFSDTWFDSHPEFVRDAVDYINGKMNWDDFAVLLDSYKEQMVQQLIEQQGYDMDPTTADTI
jgi:raffinose/stachyose/melibiose transport system substrate-binding protein